MITWLTDSCIAVVSHEDLDDYELTYDGRRLVAWDSDGLSGYLVDDLPPGQWEYLGKSDQLSEEQWKGVVEVIEGDEGFYHNYDLTTFREVYATESGHSLLRKHNLEKETTVILKRKL